MPCHGTNRRVSWRIGRDDADEQGNCYRLGVSLTVAAVSRGVVPAHVPATSSDTQTRAR